MKDIKLLLLGVIITAPSLLRAQSGGYTISGKIGQPSVAKAYLMYTNAAGAQKDSAAIINGSFTFKGLIDEPKLANLIIKKNAKDLKTPEVGNITLILEPGNITVNSRDSIQNATIKAGPVNIDYDKFKLSMAPVMTSIAQLGKDYQAASPEQKQSKAFTDNIKKRNDVVGAERKAVLLAFIKANPNSLVSIFALKSYAGWVPDANEIEPLFNSLSANVRSSSIGATYAADIAKIKVTAIGATAPDFTLTDTLGKAISLHNYRGKYVLVDFWASWCGPCRAENPNVVKNFNEYKGKGFTVLGVSLDQQNAKDKWIKAVHDDHLAWAQVSDLKGWKNEAAILYSVRAIPQNFLIGPDGKILAKNIRGDELGKTLASIFRNN